MPKKKVSEQGNLEGLVCEANQSREKSYEIQSLMSLLPRNWVGFYLAWHMTFCLMHQPIIRRIVTTFSTPVNFWPSP